jgi:hypothetical protein
LIGKFGVLAKDGELFNADTGFAKNGAQCPYAKVFVVGNRNASEWGFAAQDNVTARLTLKDKANSNRDSNEFLRSVGSLVIEQRY